MQPESTRVYFLGWRPAGRPRQWLVSPYPSAAEAARIARGCVVLDGGGPWRVFAPEDVLQTDGTLLVRRGRLLEEGFAPAVVP